MRLSGQPASPVEEAPERPWVLLVDDGELDDVKRVAEELGATTKRAAIESRGRPWRQPQRLLAVCDRRALTLGRPAAQEEDHFTTLVLVEEGGKRLRREIERMGFDYVLERPVDPEALRRLVREALYRGHEQRGRRRLPVSQPVTLQVGWRAYEATLSELNLIACSLRLQRPVRITRPVDVVLPSSLAGGKSLALHGEVIRERLAGREMSVELSVHFKHNSLTQARLGQVLDAIAAGPPPAQRP